jgi:hypothetical protein
LRSPVCSLFPVIPSPALDAGESARVPDLSPHAGRGAACSAHTGQMCLIRVSHQDRGASAETAPLPRAIAEAGRFVTPTAPRPASACDSPWGTRTPLSD